MREITRPENRLCCALLLLSGVVACSGASSNDGSAAAMGSGEPSTELPLPPGGESPPGVTAGEPGAPAPGAPSAGMTDPAGTVLSPPASPVVPGEPVTEVPAPGTPTPEPVEPADPAQCAARVLGANAMSVTPLRRLTRFEYNNTVRDLLNVVATPADSFPTDEVAGGFNNNSTVLTVSALHAEKYMEAAEALAAAAVQNLDTLLPCDAAASGEVECAQQFAETFGRRAFRRPLAQTDLDQLMSAYEAGATGGSFAEGIEVMVRAVLQSPHFLYRVETTAPAAGEVASRLNQYETATRLSYLVWGSTPDPALLDAAEQGLLQTPEQIAAKAREMLTDDRARALTEFYRQWLGLNRLDTITKDASAFPQWNEEVRAAMKAETPAFVEYVLWESDRKLLSLLTASVSFASDPLKELYGLPATGSVEIEQVPLPATERAGILTQASFLAVQSHPDQTSPVLRGKFVRDKLLCQPPPPPPPDQDVTRPEPTAGTSARERFSAHATGECQSCHQLMDPIGFAFESFDALGVYRETEAGQAIDVSGEIIASLDVDGAFVGVPELATRLAGSGQVRDCVATQWFRYAAGRLNDAADACSLLDLQQAFTASDGDLVELVVAMTQSEAFLYRPAPNFEEVAQ